LNKSRVWSL